METRGLFHMIRVLHLLVNRTTKEARQMPPTETQLTAEALDHRLEERFRTLAVEWKAGRGHSSSISKMCTHPAYQQIVGMGEKAIPLILRELEQAPDHWFWALKAITGVNPVPRDERADIKAMALHWLEWGREKGYRW